MSSSSPGKARALTTYAPPWIKPRIDTRSTLRVGDMEAEARTIDRATSERAQTIRDKARANDAKARIGTR
jgi:hypothetical protein